MPFATCARLGAAFGFALLAWIPAAVAASFAAGDLVVYRIGNGTLALSANGNPVFLDEYTPAGTLVQSVALPTAAAGTQKALVASGTATTDGWMSRSGDGACLLVSGYGRDLGTGSGNLVSGVLGSAAGGGPIPRVVGRVLATGATDTTTALTDADIAGNLRSAASTDCTQLWVSGATNGGGVRYTTLGSTTSVDLTGTTLNDTRALAVQGGQLYVSASASGVRVAAVGTGTPTAGAQALVPLPGVATSAAGQAFQFFLAQLDPASGGFDTLYYADSSGAIQKFSRAGASWSSSGAVGAGTDTYRGLTGTVSGTTVTLFATRRNGAELVSIVDASGYNGAFGGTPTLLVTAGTNTTFRGLAMAPVALTPPTPKFNVTPGTIGNGTIAPATPQQVLQGLTTAFDVVPAPGYQVAVGGTCGGALVGLHYATAPITADCTVIASFTPLPRYTVTPGVGAHGSISPASPLTVVSGDSASIVVTPAPGYNAAVRGTCGGNFAGDTFITNPVTGDCSVNVTFARKLVLFVGNSYTFGRADPVMSYNAANVTDLTHAMWLANPIGSNADEPHPWGGIPGIFKEMTDEAALEYDVSISARNAATLRGHYLNSNPAGWDLRGNVATQRYDIVMLQDQSDEPLPAGRGANANLPYFDAYVDKLERWAHQGIAESYTETQLFGGNTAACQSITGASASACDTVRTVTPGNPQARASAQVYLYETWARPDMIGPNGNDADGQFYTAAEGIEAMTRDLHDAYFNRAVANGHIEDVAPVGDAFLRAVQEGIAMRDPYVPEAGKLDLWYIDFFHPSKYGSYLSAAVHFATLTGINPLTLGPDEQAAADLGIAPADAVALQRIAQLTVDPDTTPPTTTATVSTPPNANGWNRDDVTIAFSAADNGPNLSGLDAIHYTLSGAQAANGTLGASGTLTITAEGVTTVTYHAVDRAGNAEPARTIRVAIDRTAPLITGLPGDTCSIWPPNGQMVTVGTVSAADPVSAIASFSVNASSSEAPGNKGEADVAVAGSGTGPRVISVRADRNANGPGRTYTITATAIDLAGNTAAATGTCTVPHDQGK
ncbi:MAG TPA: hypothetical protein VFE23_21125 [Usitatibacter sp.]|jgi:hypothetical protein|nr:hypothetical protein [Usitatibacter sp.]